MQGLSPPQKLAADIGQWYNTSSGEVSSDGTPYGFEHQPMSGYTAGYPVLIDPRLAQARIRQALYFLRDGQYLSSSLSKSLTIQLATYNAQLGVIGYYRADLVWTDQGSIAGTMKVQGLPAVTYDVTSIRQHEAVKMSTDLIMVALVIFFIGLLVWDIRHARHVSKAQYKAKVC